MTIRSGSGGNNSNNKNVLWQMKRDGNTTKEKNYSQTEVKPKANNIVQRVTKVKQSTSNIKKHNSQVCWII